MAAPTFSTGDVPTATQVNEWFTNIHWAQKTGTESVTSSTTLQDDDTLVVAVSANASYLVQQLMIYDGATGGDLKVGWTAPASATFSWLHTGLASTAASFSDDGTGAGDLTSAFTFGALGTGTNCGVMFHGVLTTSGTAGNFQVQWAQGTSSGTATRVFSGSFLSLRRMS